MMELDHSNHSRIGCKNMFFFNMSFVFKLSAQLVHLNYEIQVWNGAVGNRSLIPFRGADYSCRIFALHFLGSFHKNVRI